MIRRILLAASVSLALASAGLAAPPTLQLKQAATSDLVQVKKYKTYKGKNWYKGKHYKQITDAKKFPSYEEALSYIESQKSANVRIVGNNQFITPVPLEALENYKLVYGSDNSVMHQDAGSVPEVKIFEYIRK